MQPGVFFRLRIMVRSGLYLCVHYNSCWRIEMTKYPIVTVAAVLSMTALLFSQTSKPRVPPVPTSQPQPSQPPREKPPADPGVKALVESFCGAWDDHNPARMAQCWTEDGDFR